MSDGNIDGGGYPSDEDYKVAAAESRSNQTKLKDGRKCVCKWRDICSDLQANLRDYCLSNNTNHVALGCIRITTKSTNTQRLIQSVTKYLLDDTTVLQFCEIAVARHHFPLPLLEYNGIKEQQLDDLKLPPIAGNDGKIRQFFTALPKERAHAFGIDEEVDRFSKDRSHKLFKFYVQAPLVPLSVARNLIWSLTPSTSRAYRASLLSARREEDNSLTKTTIPPSTPENQADDESFIQADDESFIQKVPEPLALAPKERSIASKLLFCQGMQSQELESFVTASFANRGLASTVYSYRVDDNSWHSSNCTITCTITTSGTTESQCKHCIASSKNIQLSLPPALCMGDPWHYDSMVLCKEELHSLLRKRYSYLDQKDSRFVRCKIVQRGMEILRSIHLDFQWVALDDRGSFARHCPNGASNNNCHGVAVVHRKRRLTQADCTFCEECFPSAKRRRLLTSSSELPELNERHNFSKMTKEQLIVLLRSKSRQLRYTNRQLRNARKLLQKESKSSYVDSDDDELLRIMSSAADYVKDNKEDSRKSILMALVDASDSSCQAPDPELNDFVASILDEIENFTRVQSNKPRQVRFSPRVMRMALSLYLRGPKAYEVFRQGSIQVMPSISSLKKLKTSMTPNEGTFPRCYGWFYDEFFAASLATEADRFGHIICDEMKLKSDFYWNPSTHRCVGIAVDGEDIDKRIDLVKEARKLYTDCVWKRDAEETTDTSGENNEAATASPKEEIPDDTKSSYSVSLSVNQFRFRSAANHTHTGEFFYNNGSLSGDELLRQIKQVIMGYEMIGVRIIGLSCDGGGNNARLFKLLRFGKSPKDDQCWLDDDLVSFPNPADPTRSIAMFHCTTHGLKNLRNALHSSQQSEHKQGTKDFSLHNTSFGWKTVIRSYQRDKKRNSPDSALRSGSVYPDKWNKMDVALAKDPFRFDTLAELVLHLATGLHCVDEVTSVTIDLRLGGKAMDKLLRQLDILKSKYDPQQHNATIQEDLLTLEFCAVVGSIYLDYLMNGKEKITRENIDNIEKTLRSRLGFFDMWRGDQIEYRDELRSTSPKSRTWEKRFLAPVTYLNMRIGICGFVKYAKLLLRESEKINSVPFLHSNTSIIESLFSQIRRMQRDTPSKYPAGAGAADTTLAKLHLDNGMYSSEDLEKSVSPCKTLERVTMRMDLKRDELVDSWIQQKVEYELRRDGGLPMGVPFTGYTGEDQPLQSWGTSDQRKLRDTLQGMEGRLSSHYSDWLWSFGDFREYAKLSVGMQLQSCFEQLTDLQEHEENEFDKACQFMFTEVSRGAKDCGSSARSVHRSFMLQVFLIQCDKLRMDKFRLMIPCSVRDYDGITYFSQLLVEFIAKLFIRDFYMIIDEYMGGVKKPAAANENEQEEEDWQVSEVQFFLGWAMRSVTNKYEAKAERDDGDEVSDEVSFCQHMYLEHDDAIADDGYMRDFYSPIVQIKNRGDLALVSREYFEFGLELLKEIRRVFNKTTIKELGTSCVEIAYEEMTNNDHLKQTFMLCENQFSDKLSDAAMSTIYGEIVKKAFHARIGAETSIFKDENTSRFAVDAVDTALRLGLKAITKCRHNDAKKGKKKGKDE